MSSNHRDRDQLDEQIEYYRARATEFDQWFNREGRYDRGPAQREQWFREVAIAEDALRAAAPLGDVLELACGTGLWTRHLAPIASSVIAVDASPEMIALNRERLRAEHVEYRVADIFASMPDGPFDTVFFSFWLSHVPPERFESFWSSVRARLRPGGRAIFIDSLREPDSIAINHDVPDDSGIARRKLNDGRQFQIVKVFYDPRALMERLASEGWRGDVRSTGSFFLYGDVRRPT